MKARIGIFIGDFNPMCKGDINAITYLGETKFVDLVYVTPTTDKFMCEKDKFFPYDVRMKIITSTFFNEQHYLKNDYVRFFHTELFDIERYIAISRCENIYDVLESIKTSDSECLRRDYYPLWSINEKQFYDEVAIICYADVYQKMMKESYGKLLHQKYKIFVLPKYGCKVDTSLDPANIEYLSECPTVVFDSHEILRLLTDSDSIKDYVTFGVAKLIKSCYQRVVSTKRKSVPTNLISDYNRVANEVIDKFLVRHNIKRDLDCYWIGDDIGGIFSVNGEYFFDYKDIVEDVKRDNIDDAIFRWHDYNVEIAELNENAGQKVFPVLNYKSWINKAPRLSRTQIDKFNKEWSNISTLRDELISEMEKTKIKK